MGNFKIIFFVFKKIGITEPLDIITFPYLKILNFKSLFPLIKLALKNNLSEQSLVAPYKFTGDTALSVDKAKTFCIFLFSNAHSIIFLHQLYLFLYIQ